MKALALAPALALAAFALVAPPQAEAGHRHYRGCGHKHSSRSYGYYAPSYGYSPAPYYRGDYYGAGYDDDYDHAPRYYGRRYYPPRHYGYYYAPPPPPPRYYHRHRPRVGIYLGF